VNVTCNFLYCNHQVHREFLITRYFLAVHILGLLTFFMEVRVNAAGNTCWTYEILLLIKQPDDDTCVPKHVAIGTRYEVCFMTCCIVF